MPGKVWFIWWFLLFNKKSNIFIWREICNRTQCPSIVTLALLLFLSDWSSKLHNSQTVTAKELKFWEKVHPIPCVMCHMSRAQQLNKTGNRWHLKHGGGWTVYQNKVKVIWADLLDFDFNFQEILRFGNI